MIGEAGQQRLEHERHRVMVTHEISELFKLHAGLERQLQLGTLDDDVGEVEQVDLERIEHTLSSDDNLLRLFFDGERTNQGGHFFCSLPLGELSETLLTSPYRSVNDFNERLSSSRVEDEDSSVDRLCRQVTFEGLVNRNSVNLCVVDEPNAMNGGISQYRVEIACRKRPETHI